MQKLVLGFFALSMQTVAAASQEAFGPFVYDPKIPNALILSGTLDDRSALEFRRAVKRYPEIKVLALNSGGGSVSNGLLIADEVQDRGIATFIPQGFDCVSACAFIYFAGATRAAEGRLGVHQVYGGPSDMVSTQLTVSDIADALGRYGISSEVLAIMLRTPPDSMHYFSQDEIRQYGLNRNAPASDNSAGSAGTTQPVQSMEERAVSFLAEVLAAHTSFSAESVDKLKRYYANNLGYYGKTVSMGELIADKRAYFSRWPERAIRIRSDTVSVNCADTICHITGMYDWVVKRVGQEKSGVASFSYMIDMNGYSKITAEGGRF